MYVKKRSMSALTKPGSLRARLLEWWIIVDACLFLAMAIQAIGGTALKTGGNPSLLIIWNVLLVSMIAKGIIGVGCYLKTFLINEYKKGWGN